MTFFYLSKGTYKANHDMRRNRRHQKRGFKEKEVVYQIFQGNPGYFLIFGGAVRAVRFWDRPLWAKSRGYWGFLTAEPCQPPWFSPISQMQSHINILNFGVSVLRPHKLDDSLEAINSNKKITQFHFPKLLKAPRKPLTWLRRDSTLDIKEQVVAVRIPRRIVRGSSLA